MKYENKLSLQILILGTIIFLVVYYIAYQYNHMNIIQIELEHTSSLVDELSVDFEQRFLEKVKTNQTLSTTPMLKNKLIESNNTYSKYSDKERDEIINLKNNKWKAIKDENNAFILEFTNNELAQFFKEQQKNLPGEYGEIFLTNKYGVNIASTSKLSTLAHAHKYWWQGAYENGKGVVFFDDRGYDKSVGGYVLGVVIPIKEDNEIIGILKVNLNILGSISEMLASSKNKKNGEFKLIRSGGEIIFDNKNTPLSNRIPDILYEKIQTGEKTPFIFQDSIDNWMIGMSEITMTSKDVENFRFGGSFESSDHVQGNTGESWFIINYRTIDSIIKPLKDSTITILAFGFLLIIIIAIIALIIGKLTIKPLKHLVEQSKKIAKADFSTRIKVKRKDEIGLLGIAFNKMTIELEKSTTSIKNLESEIGQRLKAEQELKEQNVEYATLNGEYKSINKELIIAKDIAEESEQKFRTLFKENKSVHLLIDPITGNIVDANQAACNFYGYSYKELITIKIQDINQDNDERIKKEMKSAKDKELNNFEFKHKLSDGTLKDVEVYSNPILIDNVKFLISIIHDITARKNAELELVKAKERTEDSEAKFKSYTEQSPIAIYTTTIEGDCVYANETWLEITGMKLEEALGKGWVKALHPDDLVRVNNDWYNSVKSNGKWRYEYRFVNKTGKITWVEGSAKEIFNGKNELVGYLGVNVNITNRKKVEQDLKIAKLKAEESDRLKSAFLANMSHEIRTPMNGILGFAGLLKEPGLKGKTQQKYIGIIEKSGVRMLNIINDIISISKIESGQMEVNIQESNINEQIEFIYNFFNPEIKAKGMQFSFLNDLPTSEAILKTDIEKVYAILTNLIKNAIKYSEKGSIELGYNLKKTNKVAELEFYVKDTGIGIPKERQKAIFERFIQADITDKMAQQGAGLGLSISQAYVEMLGGRIWVESEEGVGSTFYFTLQYQIPQLA